MRPLLNRRLIALLIASALGGGCGASAARPPTQQPRPASIDILLRLMQRRLMLMHDVARWKWNERRPIEDPARERELLDNVTEQGWTRGLAAAFVRSFFAGQVEAAKLVQRSDFDRWRAFQQEPFRNTIELTSLREGIDGLDSELIEALVASGRDLSGVGRQELLGWADQILVGEGLDGMARVLAMEPLEGIPRGSRVGSHP